MAIRRDDPRTEAQKAADDAIREEIERNGTKFDRMPIEERHATVLKIYRNKLTRLKGENDDLTASLSDAFNEIQRLETSLAEKSARVDQLEAFLEHEQRDLERISHQVCVMGKKSIRRAINRDRALDWQRRVIALKGFEYSNDWLCPNCGSEEKGGYTTCFECNGCSSPEVIGCKNRGHEPECELSALLREAGQETIEREEPRLANSNERHDQNA